VAARLLALLCLVALSAACADTESPEQLDERAGVSVDVPDDWHRTDPEVTADVLESRQWRPAGDEVSSLQVVAGCGAGTTADDLLAGAATGERPLPVIGASDEPETVEVEGLEDARRVTFAMGPREGDVRAWMAGLYGVGDGVLVLVELMRPHARFDRGLADDVLGSVRVDAAALAERCDVGG
jgi:hypothetical protein